MPVSLAALISAASVTTAVPCWSSWKTGMSSVSFRRCLDLEAARRADVLEVDAAERGRDVDDGLDDRLGVLGAQADREGVDAAELLEQHRLALHHRHRGLGADVAQAEHGAAVGDDGDRVALDRVLEGLVAVARDRRADARHAGRVGHAEVVAGADRELVALLDLAADVHLERAVGDLDQLRALDLVDGLADLRRVLLARGLDRDVAQRVAALDRHQVYGADAPAGFADGGGDQAEHAGPVVDLHAEDDRILRRD